MFKLTITSSGKYLALWQIKPIGLHDGHLVGGEDSDFDFFFLSFLLEVTPLDISAISQQVLHKIADFCPILNNSFQYFSLLTVSLSLG